MEVRGKCLTPDSSEGDCLCYQGINRRFHYHSLKDATYIWPTSHAEVEVTVILSSQEEEDNC